MIAVTGSTGFIGSYIVDSLPFPQKRLIRKHTSMNSSANSQITIIPGELQDREQIASLVKDTPILVHLASSSHPRIPVTDISEDIRQHLTYHSFLFETFAKSNPGGHIIFSSTGGNMYSDSNHRIPKSEEEVPFPRSYYSINKLAAEHHLRLFCDRYQISATVLRISNPYGILLPSTRAQGLIGVALSCLINEKPLSIIEPWETVRDYLHLEDLKRAVQLVINKPPKKGEFRLFNLSSGKGHTLKEVIDLIEKTTGKTIDKREAINPSQVPSWSVLSSKKIERALGWSPQISLSDGIQKMWQR